MVSQKDMRRRKGAAVALNQKVSEGLDSEGLVSVEARSLSAKHVGLIMAASVATGILGQLALTQYNSVASPKVAKAPKAKKAKKLSKDEKHKLGMDHEYNAEKPCANPTGISPLDLKVKDSHKPCMDSYHEARKKSDFHAYHGRCDIDYPGRPPFCDVATRVYKNDEYNAKNPGKEVFVYVVDGFLSEEDADMYVKMVVDSNPPNSPGNTNDGDYRTSRTFQAENSVPAWAELGSRMSGIVGMPDSMSETLQVQWYVEGQQFKPHHDFWHSCHTVDPDSWKNAAGPLGQRNFTGIVYLNDVPDGMDAHTKFPQLGLSIQPKKGSLLIFKNQDDHLEPNHATQHEGAKPTNGGEKFVVTKWFRDVHWNVGGSKIKNDCLDGRTCKDRKVSKTQLIDTTRELVKMMPEDEKECFRDTKYWS